MSSYPTFDLNKFYDVSQDMMRNLATSLVYEPGSTFKSFLPALYQDSPCPFGYSFRHKAMAVLSETPDGHKKMAR
uniref:penicillin-binding transpeptidase domain-containing protein n=1 Tax=Candidatus Hakubella thermalkaliphila TaxID=2754717 RepID=UPI00387EBB90